MYVPCARSVHIANITTFQETDFYLDGRKQLVPQVPQVLISGVWSDFIEDLPEKYKNHYQHPTTDDL